jgi:hypothetical protein
VETIGEILFHDSVEQRVTVAEVSRLPTFQARAEPFERLLSSNVVGTSPECRSAASELVDDISEDCPHQGC